MTDTTQAIEGVIRTDVLGRVRTSAARRESLLGEYDQSGLSAKKFAELTGIKYQTLATWLQKRRRQGKAPVKAANTVKWLQAVMEEAGGGEGGNPLALVLELPGAGRMEIRDVKQAALAAELLRALAKSC